MISKGYEEKNMKNFGGIKSIMIAALVLNGSLQALAPPRTFRIQAAGHGNTSARH
jgi:hypothetical protein